MPDYWSNPIYLHPLLQSCLPGILEEVRSHLKPGWKTGIGSQSVHRTAAEQFELFKKGRAFQNGAWVLVDKKKKVTGIDGFVEKSRHNYLPALAVDIVLFRPDGSELDAGPEEQQIGKGAAKYGLDWGGNWEKWQDLPHIEIPPKRLFKSSLERDQALQWQKYLFEAGELKQEEDLDGLWGDFSKGALQKVVGTTERTPQAWAALREKFGPVEKLASVAPFTWMPSVLA